MTDDGRPRGGDGAGGGIAAPVELDLEPIGAGVRDVADLDIRCWTMYALGRPEASTAIELRASRLGGSP